MEIIYQKPKDLSALERLKSVGDLNAQLERGYYASSLHREKNTVYPGNSSNLVLFLLENDDAVIVDHYAFNEHVGSRLWRVLIRIKGGGKDFCDKISELQKIPRLREMIKGPQMVIKVYDKYKDVRMVDPSSLVIPLDKARDALKGIYGNNLKSVIIRRATNSITAIIDLGTFSVRTRNGTTIRVPMGPVKFTVGGKVRFNTRVRRMNGGFDQVDRYGYGWGICPFMLCGQRGASRTICYGQGINTYQELRKLNDHIGIIELTRQLMMSTDAGTSPFIGWHGLRISQEVVPNE